MNPWLRRLLETDEAPLIYWVLVASSVLSLWSFRRAIGYVSMRAVRFLWADATVARAVATARRMARVAVGFLWAAVTDRGAEAQESAGVAADTPVGVFRRPLMVLVHGGLGFSARGPGADAVPFL